MRSADNRPVLSLCRLLLIALGCCIAGGCYAPVHSYGIPASSLPDDFRVPSRTVGPPLNFSNLTVAAPPDYLLGPEDVLEVTVPGLFEQAEVRPLRAQVMSNGEVQLPLVGAVNVNYMTLQQAQVAISQAYADGFLVDPRVSVFLTEKSTTSVLVLGQVAKPGSYALAKYEDDVGHALGAAEGLAEDAEDYIEVHRQNPVPSQTPIPTSPDLHAPWQNDPGSAQQGALGPQIIRIPLRGPLTTMITQDIVKLQPNDVIVVPNRKHEVFYVVGRLSRNQTARFTVGNRERELGVGFVLPRERELDVLEAVAMAGYIDPIESPTTVTVQRTLPNGCPFLIQVDLIAARYDLRESVLVQPGDIIYLNPDGWWWWRRTLDRVLGDIITIPYGTAF